MVNTTERIARFRQTFPGHKPTLLVRAPGRVNLIGEHTDYNEGFVLPIALTQAIHVVIGPADDGQVIAQSTAFEQPAQFSASDPGQPDPPGEHHYQPSWGNYVRGVAAMLLKDGYKLRGARMLIDSQVPVGGGVSSSAALEVGTALAMATLGGGTIGGTELALLGRRAEHEYAHSPCGIMDQFISVLGQQSRALLLDCRSQTYEQIPLDLREADILVMDTQVKHNLGASEYPVRQRQCQEGLAILRKQYPRVTSLRDVKPEMLETVREKMEPVIYQRCRHVVTEIARTLEAANALRAGDLNDFGWLMVKSHESLRDDYAVSCPELDYLVEIATQVPGVYGARMTGGGFGGCAIALVRREAEGELQARIRELYTSRFGKPALVYDTQAAAGASVETL